MYGDSGVPRFPEGSRPLDGSQHDGFEPGGLMSLLALLAVVALACTNGSNDNFKGVATLYGSGTTTYGRALAWATATTLAGSLLAVALAGRLVEVFSGKGLVPDVVAASPAFVTAVALGAALTLLAATRFGLPVSTTHALTGGLLGAGWVAAGSTMDVSVLGKSIVLPLLVSPVAAAAMAAVVYPAARRARRAFGVESETCACVGTELRPIARAHSVTGPPPTGSRYPAVAAVANVAMTTAFDSTHACAERYGNRVVGVSAQSVLDALHFLSAGAVSFARGLNDAPKIFALLVAARLLSAETGLVVIGSAMAVGGLLGARKVAETMSHKITPLSAGQGFVANGTTALLVLVASRFGMPVSTTHVTTGGLFGIGLSTASVRWRTVTTILAAWVTTLPLAAALGALAYVVTSRIS